MHGAVASALREWESFYVIVGSAAGALTGLQFVVLTIIAESGPVRGRKESISAFGTPNIVHFCAGLLIASILSVPWRTMLYAGIAVAGCGVLGVVYAAIVLKRARRQSAYRPVFEDWLWHTILPVLAYSALFVAGIIFSRSTAAALFVIAAAVLLLVFIGIHNAWDTLTFVTVERGVQEQGGGSEVRGGGGAPGGSSPGSSSASRAGSPNTLNAESRPG